MTEEEKEGDEGGKGGKISVEEQKGLKRGEDFEEGAKSSALAEFIVT